MQPADPLNSSAACQSLQGSQQNYAHSVWKDERRQEPVRSENSRTTQSLHVLTSARSLQKKKKKKRLQSEAKDSTGQ